MNSKIDIDSLPDAGQLVGNYELVKQLQRAVLAAPRDQGTARDLLLEVLSREPPAYMDRLDAHGSTRIQYRREEFIKFITDPLMAGGLQSDVETLRRILGDEQPVRTKFEQALKQGPGNPTGANQYTKKPEPEKSEPEASETGNSDTITVSSPSGAPRRQGGTSVSYATARLSRDRPDLLARVEAGEISTHAAMKLAGFRREPTPLELLRSAWRKASLEDREQFLQEIGGILVASDDAIGGEPPEHEQAGNSTTNSTTNGHSQQKIMFS